MKDANRKYQVPRRDLPPTLREVPEEGKQTEMHRREVADRRLLRKPPAALLHSVEQRHHNGWPARGRKLELLVEDGDARRLERSELDANRQQRVAGRTPVR